MCQIGLERAVSLATVGCDWNNRDTELRNPGSPSTRHPRVRKAPKKKAVYRASQISPIRLSTTSPGGLSPTGGLASRKMPYLQKIIENFPIRQPQAENSGIGVQCRDRCPQRLRYRKDRNNGSPPPSIMLHDTRLLSALT